MVLSDEIRALLYPLGILSTVAFTLRFLIQWLQSEKAHRSIVTSPFWILSLFGNLSLGIHSFIQGQYPVCLVQAINGVVAIRNLNLMKPLKYQWRLSTVLLFMAFAFIGPTLLFTFFSPDAWTRVPTHSFQKLSLDIPSHWHWIGTLGVILFASRFWVQWIQAEREHKSELHLAFWWLSLAGALFSIVYFALIRDYINLVGPLFGLIPYLRNLMLQINLKKSTL